MGSGGWVCCLVSLNVVCANLSLEENRALFQSVEEKEGRIITGRGLPKEPGEEAVRLEIQF